MKIRAIAYTGKSLYNGNISETYWRVSSDNILRKYGYKYDNLNRLRESIYQKPGNSNPVPKSYDENLTYDKNGNILSLLRNGDIDGALPPNNIDNLVYTYASNANKLLSVLDTSNNNIAGFVDTNKSNDDYTYDANGNLITDKNKNITAIVYNHLNLPTKITFGTTGNIVYIYNAAGQKLEKIVTQGTLVTNTNYLGGYQYSKPNLGTWALQFFPTAEGYVKNTNGIYSYVFNYTDHLGNVRLSYSDTSKNGLIETTEIVDESHYYPFGLKHSGYVTTVPDPNYKYKYNGKELQDELGLNMYDYGARNYDPAIGRWMNVDPLAEKHPDESPYMYCGNNPIIFIDPDGRDRIYSASGRLLEDTGKGSLIKVRVGKNDRNLSELNYNTRGTRFAVGRIVANEASLRGYKGYYGVRSMDNEDTGAYTNNAKTVFVNTKQLSKGTYDDYHNLGSTIDHEEGHKNENIASKDYTFVNHANVYLEQSQTSDFSNTSEDNKYSVATGFVVRTYNAYLNKEISFDDLKSNVANFNKLNGKNGVQIKSEFDGNGVNVQVGKNTYGVDLKQLKNPQD